MAQQGGIARYKQSIKRAQKQLDETFKALGMLAYKQLKGKTIDKEGLHRLSAEVDRLLAEIKDSQEAIERFKLERQARGWLVCPACGDATGIRYCLSCGIDKTIPLQAKASEIKCPSCGQMITADSVFCGICGASTEKSPDSSVSDADSAEGDTPVQQQEEVAVQDSSSGPETEDVLDAEPSPSKCPDCGDVLEPGAAFCITCGTEVSSEVPSPSKEAGEKAYVVECSDCGWQGLESETVPRTGSTGDSGEEGVCPACGSENWDFTNKRVPDKSSSTATMVNCSYCGELAESTLKFCLNCGQSLGG